MLLEPRTLDNSASRVFASAIREDILVEEGTSRASFSRRRTEKAHFAVLVYQYCGHRRGRLDSREAFTPNEVHSIAKCGKIQRRVGDDNREMSLRACFRQMDEVPLRVCHYAAQFSAWLRNLGKRCHSRNIFNAHSLQPFTQHRHLSPVSLDLEVDTQTCSIVLILYI